MNKNSILLILSLIVSLFPSIILVQGQTGTEVGGYVSENTTWTLENSPYIVTEDIIIESDVVLGIEPGVVVKFAKGTNLVVDGALVSKGNSTHQITFTSNSLSPTPGDWGTVNFRLDSDYNISIIDWAVFTYATDALTIAGSHRIHNCTIQNNILGIFIINERPDIENCLISENIGRPNPDDQVGDRIAGIFVGGNADIKNCVIEDNKGSGISTEWGNHEILMASTIVRNNEGYGVHCSHQTIENCTIENNVRSGIVNPYGLGSAIITDSTIRNNNGNGVQSVFVTIISSKVVDNKGTGVVGGPPLFTGGSTFVNIMYSEISANKESGISAYEGEVHFNNITSNTPFDVRITDISNVNATNNWWGTTNEALIEAHIYDYYDDYTLGKVFYEPYLVPPVANFSFIPVVPFEYQIVSFNASNSFTSYGSISEFEWDFGDGVKEVVYSPVVTHVYENPGDYNVNLTVTTDFGLTNTTIVSISVLEDNLAPVTIDDYDGEWRTEDFTIELSSTDYESGVAETYYRINDGPTKTLSVDGQPVISVESADNKLEYWSEDKAGNVEEHKVLTKIKLDKSKPSIDAPITIPMNEIQAEQPVTVMVYVSDSVSGVKSVTLSYSIDEGSSWNDLVMDLNSTSGLWQATIPGQEIWTKVRYKILCYDNAGNGAFLNGGQINYRYEVVPEFSVLTILPLCFIVALLGMRYKKKMQT